MKENRFTLRGFKSPSEAVRSALGDLEREVMEYIWQRGETSVGELYLSFGERSAYTTLMTTLNRLYRKGLLERRKDGRAFLYSPCISQREFSMSVARDIIDGLLGKTDAESRPVLACIVDAVSEHDHKMLDELERLLAEKRLTLKRD